MKRRAKTWTEPPELAIPDDPAFVTDCDNAWIAYEVAHCDEPTYAVIKFAGLIDIHLSPINDEGLGEHPYASTGLRCYTFHELIDTDVTTRWASIGGRQFVITFKDVTIDVIASSPSVVATDIRSDSADGALQLAVEYASKNGG